MDPDHRHGGGTITFRFSPCWENLYKTVVFRCDETTKDVVGIGNEAVIPAEVLMFPGQELHIGVYGIDAEGDMVIPTKWASAGLVYVGANPSRDTTPEATHPVCAQLQNQLGSLEKLDTNARESVVAAVNGVLAVARNMVPDKKISCAVASYLTDNPVNVDGLVAFDTIQALTEEQQALARIISVPVMPRSSARRQMRIRCI